MIKVNIVTSYMFMSRVCLQEGAGIFLFTAMSITALGHIQPFTYRVSTSISEVTNPLNINSTLLYIFKW
jgi:hypothetical protein